LRIIKLKNVFEPLKKNLFIFKKSPACLLLVASFFLFSGNAEAQKLPVIDQVSFKNDTIQITAYGAKCDGIFLNTNAIQQAIDACNKIGGGTVLVPRGLWLTGAIVLKSNVNLCVSKEAILQFSSNSADYPLFQTNWEGLEAIRAQSPIYAKDAENIGITGSGVIDGAGQAWRPVKKDKVTSPEWKALVASGGVLNDAKNMWYPTQRALDGSKMDRPGVIAAGFNLQKAEAIKEFLRPNMVSLVSCKKVLLEGVTFQNSPAWCIHPLLTQHITLRNLTVRNPWNAQNGDGVDFESCRYVLVENSTFDVGDDGICIKSGRDEEGRKRGVPTEDVIIRGCTVFHGHGGFVVGSEMSGGARNIFVDNCNFLGTDIGLRFKTTRGRGGVVEKIYMTNIRMNNIGGAAILFDMYYMGKDPLTMFSGEGEPVMENLPVDEGTPQFRDLHINGVVCQGAETAIMVRGLPEMNIKDITIENVSIQSKKGLVCIEGSNIMLKNATLYCEDKNIVTLHNSKGIILDHVEFNPSDLFMRVSGANSKEIQVINSDLKNAKKEIELSANISNKKIVTIK
jgi:DNA sulfur modification protein DndE